MATRKKFPREWSWPGKEKIALTVGVPFEAFEKQSQVSLVGQRGQLDRFSLSYGDYGWKAGIWRIMNILDEYGIKSVSDLTNAKAAALFDSDGDGKGEFYPGPTGDQSTALVQQPVL